jgi:hypothetical protein
MIVQSSVVIGIVSGGEKRSSGDCEPTVAAVGLAPWFQEEDEPREGIIWLVV